MKPSEEIKNAFPQPDARFYACVRHTLNDLSAAPERRIIPMKQNRISRKVRTGTLIAAATLVLTTIAVGAAVIHYGVFDFFYPTQAQPLPGATHLVQTPQATAQTVQSAVIFTVREVLYDGMSANVLIAATPQSDNVLLLPADSAPEFPITDLGLEGSQTIAEYAAEHGKTQLYSLSIMDQGVLDGTAGFVASQDFKMEPDGTMVICVANDHASTAPNVPIDMICTAVPVDMQTGHRHADAIERTTLTFTLDNSQADPQQYTFSTPTVYEQAGVTVQSLELKSTALGLYYTLHCQVTDQAAYDALDGGLFFWFVDENGSQLPSAAAANSGFCGAPDETGAFTQQGALAPCEKLPESLTVSAVNIWENKKLLDTHTFTR